MLTFHNNPLRESDRLHNYYIQIEPRNCNIYIDKAMIREQNSSINRPGLGFGQGKGFHLG